MKASRANRLVTWTLLAATLLLADLAVAQHLPSGGQGSPIVQAVMEDNAAKVAALAARGADLNTIIDGHALLALAIVYQRNRAAEALVLHGAKLNAKDNEGRTPLHWAVCVSLPLTKLLLEHGANPNIRDRDGESPIYQAMLHSVPGALLLLEHGASATVRNNKDQTPLHIAVGGGVGLAAAPLGHPLSAHQATGSNIMQAATDAQLRLVRALLDRGADVHARDQVGRTPLDYAMSPAVKALLEKHGAVKSPDISGAGLRSPLLQTLPAHPTHAELDERLRRAIETDDLATVNALLDRGANPNARYFGGATPLAVAMRVAPGAQPLTPESEPILQALVARHADVNARDESGQTLLALAAVYNRLAAVSFLLKHGVNPNAGDQQGITPLMRAEQPPVIQALVAGGASVNAQDASGSTALMWAVTTDQVEAVKALLKAHARTDIRDKHGLTALAIAKLNAQQGRRDAEIIRLLTTARGGVGH